MLPKKARNMALLLVLGIGTVALGLTRSVSVAGQDDADTTAKIESAMSAGPASIAADATILDNAVDDAGKYVVLREGTNGWSCLPDVPATPGNDPQCYDEVWMDWNYAYLAGEAPNVTAPGIAYMLQGGSDPSNTDPLATAPAAGEDWVTSPPHIMVLAPGNADLTAFTTDHDAGQPYVMWADTPYQHLMVPVADGEHKM